MLRALQDTVINNYGYGASAEKPYQFVKDMLEQLSQEDKLQFLNNLLDQKNGAGFLPVSIRDEIVNNPLQPTLAQCYVLKAFNDIYRFSEHALEEWLNIFSKLCLFKRGEKDTDYDARVDYIWNKWNMICINDKETKLVLMDGHGRIVYRLLKKIHDNGLQNSRKIVVVDLDQTVDRWHKAFFPSCSVESVHGDIFKQANRIKPCFLYLNFCGIAGMVENTMNISNQYILSFSTMRRNADLDAIWNFIDNGSNVDLVHETGEISKLLKYLKEIEFEKISIRRDFVTICVMSI